MTDKQIMIDGVDVSGCIHYKNKSCIADYCLTDMPFDEAKCELSPKCYYKQLKRKEQEYNKLKQILTDIEFWVREFLKRTGQVVPNEIRQILRIISEVGNAR